MRDLVANEGIVHMKVLNNNKATNTVRIKSGKHRGNYGETMGNLWGIADTVVIPRLKYGTMV